MRRREALAIVQGLMVSVERDEALCHLGVLRVSEHRSSSPLATQALRVERDNEMSCLGGCRSTASEEIFPDWKARMKEQSWLFLGRRVCLSGLHDRQEHA